MDDRHLIALIFRYFASIYGRGATVQEAGCGVRGDETRASGFRLQEPGLFVSVALGCVNLTTGQWTHRAWLCPPAQWCKGHGTQLICVRNPKNAGNIHGSGPNVESRATIGWLGARPLALTNRRDRHSLQLCGTEGRNFHD